LDGLPPPGWLSRQPSARCSPKADGGPHLEGDVEKHVAGRRPAASTAGVVDEPPDLLVARPRQAQSICDQANTSVRLGDANSGIVKPLDRGDEPDVGPGSGASHPETIAHIV
jgi:hypothetical protein